MGGTGGGHYVAQVDTGSGEWMCFDDQRVDSIQPERVSGASAYVLFYKLQKKENGIEVPQDKIATEFSSSAKSSQSHLVSI